MVMSRHQNGEQNNNLMAVNRSEYVAKLKYFEATVINQIF
jgi:hypothetical protein